ncbi:hypothetical protein [uncultured Jatrophihabitans sp.]|uniref:hypothetical protein n=1 Tax=uncultured Jatrophihabitans sp. TaxID=1610747 RepID=UPI0035CB97AB
MHDPLHRLYRAKLLLLATLLLFVGLGLLIFGHWIQHTDGWRWFADWPLSDIGSGMFTTGLLGVAWQYVDGQDSEVRDTERLKRVLAESAPAMRDAVIGGFAFEPEDLARVATPEVLDQIVTNGLALRLGDAGFAKDIYQNVRQQAVGVPERLHDARISVHLSPLPAGRGTAKGRAALFVATIRWEAALHPQYQTRRFTCVSDIAEFRDIKQESAANSAWYVGPRTGLAAEDRQTFELLDFTVDGQARAIRRTTKKGSQSYSVSLGQEAMTSAERVTIAYTTRTLVAVHEHLLQLRVDQPTRGLSVELDYGSTTIEHVNVLDFIAGSEPVRVARSATSVPEKVVTVEFDGWAFPRSGVAFVWS